MSIGLTLAAALAVLGLFTGAWASGQWLLQRLGLKVSGAAAGIALATGLGLAAFSYVVFLLNAVHAATPFTLASAWLLWVGLGIAGWFRLPKPQFDPRSLTPWTWLLLLGFGVLAVLNFIPALTPAVDWDGVAYHLALPKLYLQAHGFVFRPDIFHNLFPQFTEMLFQPALLLPYGSAAKTLHAACGVLAALAVYAALRECQVQRPFALLGAAFFYGQYLVHIESGTAFIDLASTAYVGLGLLAFLAGRSSAHPEKMFLLGFFFLGVNAATKWHGLIVAGLAWMLAAAWLAAERDLAWPQKIRRLALAAFWLLLPVAPYFLRAWILGGNPVWPLGFAVFGGRAWNTEIAARVGTFVQQFAGVEHGARGFLRLPWDLLAHGDRFGVGGPQLRWPLLGCALLLAAAGIFLWKNLKTRRRFQTGTAAVAGLLLLGTWFHSSPQIRFLLAVFPLAAWLAGWLASRLWQAGREARIATLMAAVLLLAVRPGVHRDTLVQLRTLAGQVPAAEFIGHGLPHYPACAFLNRQAAGDGTILLFGENRGFYLDSPYLWGDPMIQAVLDYRREATPEALGQALSRLGVRWVLFRTDLYGPDYLPPEIVKTMETVLDSQGELKAEFGPVRVYRLK